MGSIFNQDDIPLTSKIIMFLAATLLVSATFFIALFLVVDNFSYSVDQQFIVDWVKEPVKITSLLSKKGISELEIDHLVDVGRILFIAKLLMYQELLLAFIFLITIMFLNKKLGIQTFRIAGIGGVGLTAILGIFVGFFFDSAFELFHKILFPQGNYAFPVHSYLKIALPDSLFMSMGLTILGLALLFQIMLLMISYVIPILMKKKKAKSAS